MVTLTEVDGGTLVTTEAPGVAGDLGVVVRVGGVWRALAPSGLTLGDCATKAQAVKMLEVGGGWPNAGATLTPPEPSEPVEVGEPPPGHPLNPVDPST